jgi:hypothetical protein
MMPPFLHIFMLMYTSYMVFNIKMRCSFQVLSGIAKMGGLPPKNKPLYSYNRHNSSSVIQGPFYRFVLDYHWHVLSACE